MMPSATVPTTSARITKTNSPSSTCPCNNGSDGGLGGFLAATTAFESVQRRRSVSQYSCGPTTHRDDITAGRAGAEPDPPEDPRDF